MKPTTLLILGAAGYVAYLLFSDGKSKAAVTLKTAANKINLQWNSGVPVPIPKDGNAMVNKIEYYQNNPDKTVFDVLFPNLSQL